MIKAAKEAEFKNSLILDAFRALQKIDVDFVNDEDWQIWRTWFKRIDPEETEASEKILVSLSSTRIPLP